MYTLSEQQTDYILSDIRRRGVEMEDLQLNLLDHICCIIEQNLEEGEDFEAFYRQTIPKFFKHELWEIEHETITLLTFKNYYAMKKTMITSGAIAVASLIGGSFFKIMHWPGAGVMLVFGIGILSTIFLPLMFTLRMREAATLRERLVAATGTLVGILLCVSTLFKLMHWPGATILWLATSATSIFLFIPIYFFNGIRKPELKLNTVVTTIILIGATGLLFSLTNLRPSALTESSALNSEITAILLTHGLDQINDNSYERIQASDITQKEKIAAFHRRSTDLMIHVDSLINQLSQGEHGAMFGIKHPYWVNYAFSQNWDKPTRMLFSNEEVANPVIMDQESGASVRSYGISWDKDIKSDKLQKIKNDFLNLLAYAESEFNCKPPSVIHDVPGLEPTGKSGFLQEDGTVTKWEMSNFYRLPLGFVTRNLLLLKLNISIIETEVLLSTMKSGV